jgi:hypothetical protein
VVTGALQQAREARQRVARGQAALRAAPGYPKDDGALKAAPNYRNQTYPALVEFGNLSHSPLQRQSPIRTNGAQ